MLSFEELCENQMTCNLYYTPQETGTGHNIVEGIPAINIEGG